MEEKYFSDESIIEQSIAAIQTAKGHTTNGISLVIETPKNSNSVEIVLEYEELKAALEDLEADRDAMSHLYT